ncbi:hypothetical protein HN51_032330 [Arachis hypogaea]|uniref:Ig-like domain-containing protein n=2 Tax=Arachis TaxID=3817 RepID=A0A445B4U8_ARAHY|nr:protein POLAR LOCALIZATION DURING ASYMMETRIC DIVISION AND REDISTRIBUTION [Arachis duranensis]XP_025623613.1 protein POLAR LOCALIZATION DURING ASYMMETRIC DIVISION AND REDISTRIBUTION [Arachis hypogaea]QHO16640.1 Protein POLAR LOCALIZATION DURING ASYMMETRIC DIVISION AND REDISTRIBUTION [Arachis hypogaea]RYR33707.1 hypothetical protein Ahy_A10g048326 [Arachis hypogaea]
MNRNNETPKKKKSLLFESSNPNLTNFPRRLSVADILLTGDEDENDANSMAGVGKPSLSARCYSPWRLLARLLKVLRHTKGHTVALRRRQQNETPQSTATTPSLINVSNGSKEFGELHDDASFKLGVGCGLLYMIAASKNELGKMVELRKEMEMLLQNVKGVLQSKDALIKPLKQNEALACSITDVQEVSDFHSPLSVHSKTPYVHQESTSAVVHKHFLEYNINDRNKLAEEINELEAEFEVELERLQLYMDREAVYEDAKHEIFKVNAEDSHSKSHSLSSGEIVMDPQGACADVSFAVPPVELERRLHELLQARMQEQISELESALECTTHKLAEKEIEVTWWKDTAKLVSQHLPETSRFTFRLDPDTALKLSQVV